MSELQVDSRELEEVVLLYPRGFINAHTVRLFEGEIQKALDQRRFKIVVSCAELKYIASAGLGALMGVIEEVRTNGGDIRLADLARQPFWRFKPAARWCRCVHGIAKRKRQCAPSPKRSFAATRRRRAARACSACLSSRFA